MDGVRTLHDIWEASLSHLGDEAATQDEIIGLLGRLHTIGALKLDVTPDCQELFQRVQQNKKNWFKSLLRSPLSVRIPLFDPYQVLNCIMPWVGPLFSRAGFIVWLIVIIWGVFVAGLHWPELTRGASDQILDPSNLLMLLFVYPVMKLFHEFGHAITTRKWGGEVHEMGITLLVFVPVPYVDASAMTIISSRARRMIVSASGMMVELFIAALALLIWINVEPGFLRLAAFNVMLVGGVSTLFFNGNPLLRFDAYYILKDAIEIPNLASRSTRYLSYLAQRYLFGIENAQSPVTRNRERSWFLWYGLAAIAFRLLMIFIIVLFVASQFFVVGVLIAIWATMIMVVMPVVKLVRFVMYSQSLAHNRQRALSVSLGMLATVCGLIFLMPVPSATKAQGVLWVPDQAQVQAGTDGVVTEVLATPSSQVEIGQPLLAMSDPTLQARIKVLEAELAELKVRYRIEYIGDKVLAALTKEEMNSKLAELERERERAQKLYVHSAKDGEFVLNKSDDLPGHYVRQGEQIGFVLDRSSLTVRVAVPQNRIGLIRETLHGVDVKLAESVKTTIPATLSRGVPAAQQQLPSGVLGSKGGGSIPVDPSDHNGLKTLESVFVFDVTLQEAPVVWRIGQRAYVKFDHGKQPLAEQWYRLGRQLFIRRFGV
jgi:putative peptide zinc metalloprotease protein